MAKFREYLQEYNEREDCDAAAGQKGDAVDCSSQDRKKKDRIGIGRKEKEKRCKHKPRMIAPEQFVSNEERHQRCKEQPRRGEGSAARIEHQEPAPQPAKGKLGRSRQPGSPTRRRTAVRGNP